MYMSLFGEYAMCILCMLACIVVDHIIAYNMVVNNFPGFGIVIISAYPWLYVYLYVHVRVHVGVHLY